MKIKLKELKFKAGKCPGGTQLTVPTANVVVFVGPNNSGKSKALREIERWCSQDRVDWKVLSEVIIDYPSNVDEVISELRKFEVKDKNRALSTPDSFLIGKHQYTGGTDVDLKEINPANIRKGLERPDSPLLRNFVFGPFVLRLDGRTRFNLTNDQPTGDLQTFPKNHLWALFKNNDSREKVRKLTEEAFGLHFVIDPTGMNTFRIRLSSSKPPDTKVEQGLDEESRTFHSSALPIQELSDGIQAFVGLTAAVLSLENSIILIDEPEAFLHPPLARRLGSNLTTLAKNRNATLVVSTHSPDFLMGCMESAENVAVVRLTYESATRDATATTIDSPIFREIMKSALLRSTGVIQSIFHRAAIVGESDNDRVFYSEINRRLNSNQKGVEDCLFLNAQNKQTIHKIVGPLRALGLPAVAVIDLDYFRDRGANWANLLNACGFPQKDRNELDQLRNEVSSLLEQASSATLDAFKKGGRKCLKSTDTEKFDRIISKLNAYGLFVLPYGELESWLSDRGVVGKGSQWLVSMFESIGDNDDSPKFLKPSEGDVWQFLNSISAWIKNPSRMGMNC